MTDTDSPAGDYGAITGPSTIRFERTLPGPIERVWAYLTERELRATWLGGTAIPPTPGAEFESRWGDGDDECMLGRVDVYRPPHELEYTLMKMPSPEGSITDSVMRFELTAVGDAVQLVLTHRALPARSYGSVGAGWHACLDALAAELSGGPKVDMDARWAEISAHYEQLATN